MLLFLLLAQTAVETQPTHDDTLRILVSGTIRIDGIFRDGELVDSRTVTGPPGGGTFSGTPNMGASQWTFESDLGLRLDVELQESVDVVVSVRVPRLQTGTATLLGANPEATGVIFDEASVTIREVLDQSMRVAVGIVPIAFDVRGKGSAFFFDPRHSNPFSSNTSVSGTILLPGQHDELQPTGVTVTYQREKMAFVVFALPAVIEGGFSSADEAAYGTWFLWQLDVLSEGSRVGAIFAADTFAGSDTLVYTIGGGLVYTGFLKGLEFYAEAYTQFGDAGGPDAGGVAFQAGGEFHLQEQPNNLWFGLNFTYVSGDGNATDGEVEAFLSYENVNDLLILEDQRFGIDLDHNYWSLKVGGGLAFTVGERKNNLEVSALFGFNRLIEEAPAAGLVMLEDAAKPSIPRSKEIGHEIDARVRYLVSAQVSVYVLGAFLFDSEVSERMGTKAEDRMFLGVVGTDVKF